MDKKELRELRSLIEREFGKSVIEMNDVMKETENMSYEDFSILIAKMKEVKKETRSMGRLAGRVASRTKNGLLSGLGHLVGAAVTVAVKTEKTASAVKESKFIKEFKEEFNKKSQ